MTKKTRNFLLTVFEYCLKEMCLAKREGVLALEVDCYSDSLTGNGKIIFNKKVDVFISRLLRFIVDAWYSTEGNLELLKYMSRWTSKKTKTALQIASTCMDYLANGKKPNTVLLPIGAYVGKKNNEDFIDLYKKVESGNEKLSQKLVLTADQRKRIEEVNVYFKMKEAECELLFKKKYEEVYAFHARVPELKKYYAIVHLLYVRDKAIEDTPIFTITSLESTAKRDSGSFFIEELPVCYSLLFFWNSCFCCDRNIKEFMNITDDIPNKLEKFLDIDYGMIICNG